MNSHKRSFKIASLGECPFPDLIPKANLYDSEKNSFYLVQILSEADLPLVELVLKSDIPKDQLIFYGSPSNLPSHWLDSRFHFLVNFPDEPKQIFKQRIQEVQEDVRSGILRSELERAREEVAIAELEASEWLERQGAAHIAFSICKYLDFSLGVTRKVISATLRREKNLETLEPIGIAIIALSFEGWRNKSTPTFFRDEFRNRIATLSFKQKTELREAFEACLEKFWEHPDAA